MASSYSTNLAIELIGTGDQAGTWGVTTNTNLGTLIEQAISGYVTQAVSTGTDTTITIPNGATGVARNMYIELTGTGGAATNLIVPSNKKLYFIFNNTASGQVTVKVAGQTGVSVPNGAKMILVSNGTDIVDATNFVGALSATSLTVSSGSTLNGGVVINELGADADTRIEGDTDANLFFVDASTDRIGVGTNAPSQKLHVVADNPRALLEATSTGYAASQCANSSGNSYFGRDDSTGSFFGAANATVVYSSSSNPITFYTAATEKMRIDSAGNLGLGVTPSFKLDISGGGTTAKINTLDTFDGGASLSTWMKVGRRAGTGTNAYINTLHDGSDAVSALTWAFGTSSTGTEVMRLDASGNLGVGNTSTSIAKFSVSGSGSANSIMTNTTASLSGTGNAVWIGDDGTDALIGPGNSGSTLSLLSRSGGVYTKAVNLNSSGNLGVGTTSPSEKLEVAGAVKLTAGNLSVAPSTTTNAAVTICTNAGGTFFAGLDSSTGGTFGVGNYSSVVYNGANTPMVFFTNATERARITSGGFFKASNDGTYLNATGNYHEFRTNVNDTGVINVTSNSANGTQYGIGITTANDQNDTTRYFLNCTGGATERATIRSNGGLANYSANNVNLASDERLKKDISPLDSAWGKVKEMEVVNFRYKDCNEGDPLLYGVIAQQVQPIVPELVVVTQEAKEAVAAKDAVLDEEGNVIEPAVEAKEATPEYYGIREQPMYWLAIKALQEAMTRIEELEAKVAALEAK